VREKNQFQTGKVTNGQREGAASGRRGEPRRMEWEREREREREGDRERAAGVAAAAGGRRSGEGRHGAAPRPGCWEARAGRGIGCLEEGIVPHRALEISLDIDGAVRWLEKDW